MSKSITERYPRPELTRRDDLMAEFNQILELVIQQVAVDHLNYSSSEDMIRMIDIRMFQARLQAHCDYMRSK